MSGSNPAVRRVVPMGGAPSGNTNRSSVTMMPSMSASRANSITTSRSAAPASRPANTSFDEDVRAVRAVAATMGPGTVDTQQTPLNRGPASTSDPSDADPPQAALSMPQELQRAKETIARERARAAERERALLEQLAEAKARPKDQLSSMSTLLLGQQQEELKQLRDQTQKLAEDLAAERQGRAADKREALEARTALLKGDAERRGQDGEIVGRVMQIMAEYEAIVQSSEQSSLARLYHHMESFEREWVRRTREFEERKGEFEAAVMEKMLRMLQANTEAVEAVGARLGEETIQRLRTLAEQRLSREEQAAARAEDFKRQYAEVLESEFADRCRAQDAQVAERERRLVAIVAEERARAVAEERRAAEARDARLAGTLEQAIRDNGSARAALQKEYLEREEALSTQFAERTAALAQEQRQLQAEAGERIAQAEARAAAAVQEAQRQISMMQAAAAKREAEIRAGLVSELASKAIGAETTQRAQELQAMRDEVEKQWRATFEELNEKHSKELEQQAVASMARAETIQREAFTKEQELRRSHEERLIRMEESADERWGRRLQEATKTLDRHLEVIQVLRDDNEQLTAQLESVRAQYELRETEVASKISAVHREHEQLWHGKMEEMRLRYDKLLEEALSGSNGSGPAPVTRAEHEAVLAEIRERDERLISMQKRHAEILQREREETTAIWQARLEEERSSRPVWEEQQLAKLAALRVEVLGDSRRREAELLKQLERERNMLHEDATKRLIEEKKDRDAFEAQVRAAADARVREAIQAADASCEDRRRRLAAEFEERSAQLDARAATLRQEQSEYEAAVIRRADEWLQKEKEAILADVTKFRDKAREDQYLQQQQLLKAEATLRERYAASFAEARDSLMASGATLIELQLQHQRGLERLWLEARASEMDFFSKMRAEQSALLAADAMKQRENLMEELKEMLRRERAAFTERSEETYAAIAANIWANDQRYVTDIERRVEEVRGTIEKEVRQQYDTLIKQERQRSDAAAQAATAEFRAWLTRRDEEQRASEDEWAARSRAAEELIRSQMEERIKEVRRSTEQRLSQREKEFADERIAASEEHARALLKAEERVATLNKELIRQKEQYAADLMEQQQRMDAMRMTFEADVKGRLERVITELKANAEKRELEMQQREKELTAAHVAAMEAVEDRTRRQLDELVRQQHQAIVSAQENADSRVIAAEKRHDEALKTMRAELEIEMKRFSEETIKKTTALHEEAQQEFSKSIEESTRALIEERRRGADAQARIMELQTEVDTLRAMAEQRRLETERAVETHYEGLLAEQRERTEKEIEAINATLLDQQERHKRQLEMHQTATEKTQDQDRSNSRATTPSHSLTPGTHTPSTSVAELAAADQVKKKRVRLEQLWRLLETPAAERNAFIETVAGRPATETVSAVAAEVRRLETMLPLLETITRKDFIEQRIAELARFGSARSAEIAAFTSELQALLQQLEGDVQRFEGRHKCPFFYRGERYLHRLAQDRSVLNAAIPGPSAERFGATPKQPIMRGTA